MKNIFTDASIITSSSNETIGCAGAICMENNSLNKFEIYRDSTNNISEISAIKLAVKLAIENNLSEINIWSDSQWSVFGLTKWIRSWISNMDNYILKNSSGDPVKNQQIFLSIMKLIIDKNLRVNFYHIKGHVNPYDIKSINHAISVFNRSNGISISREKMYHAVNMNNMVDNETRNRLRYFKDVQPISLSRNIANPILSKEDLIIYYNLVTLGGKKL